MDLFQTTHTVVQNPPSVGLSRGLAHTCLRQLLSGDEIAGGVKLESAIQLLQLLVGLVQRLVPSGVIMQDVLQVFHGMYSFQISGWCRY